LHAAKQFQSQTGCRHDDIGIQCLARLQLDSGFGKRIYVIRDYGGFAGLDDV
jgi:hypothetical protein